MSGQRKVPRRRFKEFQGAGEWEKRKLGDITTYSNGYGHENYVLPQGKYELITLKSINSEGKIISSGKYIDIDTDTLKKGTIIMMLSEQAQGMLGMTTVIPCNNKYVLNQRIASLTPLDGYDSSFLTKAINKKQRYFEQMGAGTKVQNISKGNVENCILYIPNINEQKKIGEYLDKLNTLTTLNQRKLEKLKSLKKAYLTQMFPSAGERKPKLRFAGFNDEWEQCKLGDICTTITKGTTPNDKSWEGPVNYIKTESIDKESGLLSNTCNTSMEEHEGFLKRSQLEKNDVLFSIVGTLGRVGVVKDKDLPANTNQQIAIIRLNDANPYFILNTLKTPLIESFIASDATIGAQPSLSLWQINDMKIKLPNEDEQEKIGEYFANLDKLITLHQRKLEKLQNLKKAYLNEMFI